MLLFFAGGCCAGSFINAAAMRTVLGVKWWGNERSVCDTCGETLAPRDLVPVLSYLILRGRCRMCGARIPLRHLLAELVCGVLTAALFARWGLCWAYVMSLIVLYFSAFNALTDLENGYIYDLWALAPGVAGLILRLSEGMAPALDGLIGAGIGFGFIAVIIIVSRGGMGWGDAMLMAGIGGAVGWRYTVFSLYAGFLIGGVVVVPMLLSKKLRRKDAIPLGPFLAAGSILVLFIGNRMLPYVERFMGLMPGWPFG